jgi:hypothetical protein
MLPIFDSFCSQPLAFRPKTATDLFALRLAFRLGDAVSAGHYAQLAYKYPESRLLVAFRRAVSTPGSLEEQCRRFHLELDKVQGSAPINGNVKLLAIRVERRSVAAAIFYGSRLEYSQVRQLSSDKNKILPSALRFIAWISEQFPLDSATVESIPNGNEIQRRLLKDAIAQSLLESLLPIWEVSKKDLFQAYGHPPLKSRRELREVVTSMWPVLAGTNAKAFIQDAVALGLYVQVERLFLN